MSQDSSALLPRSDSSAVAISSSWSTRRQRSALSWASRQAYGLVRPLSKALPGPRHDRCHVGTGVGRLGCDAAPWRDRLYARRSSSSFVGQGRAARRRWTTVSASSRPRRVSTTRPRPTAAGPSTSPSAMSAGDGAAPGRAQVVDGQPLDESGAEQHPLVVALLVGQGLARLGGRDSPAPSRAAYALGCLTFHQRTPPTWLCAPGADAPPVAARPVGDVVAAAGLLGARPVAHLVPPEAGSREQLSASSYLSASSSSSGMGTTPRRTCAASLVPCSTTRA